jgi:hypothetical protein
MLGHHLPPNLLPHRLRIDEHAVKIEHDRLDHSHTMPWSHRWPPPCIQQSSCRNGDLNGWARDQTAAEPGVRCSLRS